MAIESGWCQIIASLYVDILKKKYNIDVTKDGDKMEVLVYNEYRTIPIRVYYISENNIKCINAGAGSEFGWGTTWEDAR